MNGPWHALQKISVRWEGTPPPSKSFHPKYLFRMRLCRFPVPLEHPRVPHAAFNNPEQLIVRLARRMEGKHRRARIERVFRFALGGIVRITLAAAQSPLKSLIPAIKFSSVGAIGFTRCGACRAAARSSARCAKTFSVCGGWRSRSSATIRARPPQMPRGKRQHPHHESQKKFTHGTSWALGRWALVLYLMNVF